MYTSNFSRPWALLLFFLFIAVRGKGQISLPFHQDFENEFSLSPDGCTKEACLVQILPRITANESRASSRVYRNGTEPFKGGTSLGLTPTSTYSAEVVVDLGTATWPPLYIEFYAKSLKNGTADQRSSLLAMSYSIDEGKTFSKETLVDTFKNVSAVSYRLYKNLLTVAEQGVFHLLIKIKASRAEDFSGLAAKVVMDELLISNEPVMGFANARNSQKLKVFYQDDETVLLSKSMEGTLFNLQGIALQHVQGQVVDVKNIADGIYMLQSSVGELIKISKK